MSATTVDGFYAAYLTGLAGNGLVLLVIRNGTIAGADATGLAYDGDITQKPDGTGFRGRLSYLIPTGMKLVTGGETAAPTNVDINFDLPDNFASGVIVPITTPLGPINAKFAKLRSID